VSSILKKSVLKFLNRTVYVRISTPPIHIGPVQILCTSHSLPSSVPDGGDWFRRHTEECIFFQYKLICSSDSSLLLTYNYFPNLLSNSSNNNIVIYSGKLVLPLQAVGSTVCLIYKTVYNDICSLVHGFIFTIVSIPAQVAWSF
jgi:hypothetical protein